MLSDYWGAAIQLVGVSVVGGIVLYFIRRKTGTVESYVDVVVRACTQRMNDAGYIYDEHTTGMLIIMALFVSMLVGSIFSLAVAVCAPVVVFCGGWIFLRYRKKVVEAENIKINDEVCYLLGRLLRAGHSLDHAVATSSVRFPTSDLLQGISRQQSAGASLKQSIEYIEVNNVHIATPEKMLCATLILAHAMGGNSARIFERIGDSFHQTYELIADTSSALAHVRMSMYVIVSLPVVMVIFSLFLGSDTTAFLFTHRIGWMCLIIGVSLEVAGTLWMKKLVDTGVGTWTS